MTSLLCFVHCLGLRTSNKLPLPPKCIRVEFLSLYHLFVGGLLWKMLRGGFSESGQCYLHPNRVGLLLKMLVPQTPLQTRGDGPGTHGLHAAAWGPAGTRQQSLSTFPVFRPAAPQVLMWMGMLTVWRAHEVR